MSMTLMNQRVYNEKNAKPIIYLHAKSVCSRTYMRRVTDVKIIYYIKLHFFWKIKDKKRKSITGTQSKIVWARFTI